MDFFTEELPRKPSPVLHISLNVDSTSKEDEGEEQGVDSPSPILWGQVFTQVAWPWYFSHRIEPFTKHVRLFCMFRMAAVIMTVNTSLLLATMTRPVDLMDRWRLSSDASELADTQVPNVSQRRGERIVTRPVNTHLAPAARSVTPPLVSVDAIRVFIGSSLAWANHGLNRRRSINLTTVQRPFCGGCWTTDCLIATPFQLREASSSWTTPAFMSIRVLKSYLSPRLRGSISASVFARLQSNRTEFQRIQGVGQTTSRYYLARVSWHLR